MWTFLVTIILAQVPHLYWKGEIGKLSFIVQWMYENYVSLIVYVRVKNHQSLLIFEVKRQVDMRHGWF